MRCFIAIDIDQRIRDQLRRLQSRLCEELDPGKGQVKWVNPENAHITLKFLGDVSDAQLPEICRAIETVAAQQGPMELEFESLGSFGRRYPTVLWVGITRGQDRLRALQAQLEKALAQAGIAEDARKFTGHLTVCRIRSSRAGKMLADKAEDFKDFKPGRLRVEQVKLYQSQLTPKGPLYQAMCCYNLQ